MKILRANDATTLFRGAAEYLWVEGQTVKRNGQIVRESRGPVTVALANPRRNMVLDARRRINPWVSLAEFPWMVAGRDDISWLRRYMARAINYSDDGFTWRGAYGPRLRAFRGWQGDVDQLAYVERELIRDLTSRRAVATIWDPGLDHTLSKDYPCTNWMHFLFDPRRQRLDLHVVMRSNDLWWGWSGVNIINFSTLLELMANVLNTEPGTYYHTSNNLHIYDRHFKAAEAISMAIGESFVLALEAPSIVAEGGLARFTLDCRRALSWVTERWWTPWAESGAQQVAKVAADLGLEPGHWLAHWAQFMDLHRATLAPEPVDPFHVMARTAAKGWRLAAMQWMQREQEAKPNG